MTERFPTSRVVFDEGGTARQRVIIEDADKSEGNEIVNLKHNEGDSTKSNAPDCPMGSERPNDSSNAFEHSGEPPGSFQALPTPSEPSGRPQQTERTPTRGDGARYVVSSKGPSTFDRMKLPGTKA